MRPDEELARAVSGRPHWRLDGTAAVYAPPGAAAVVRVVPISGGGHRERFRAVIVRDGRAEHTRPAGTAVEAVRWASQQRL